MNHTHTHFNNSIDSYFENIQKHKNELLDESFKDKDNKFFNINQQKMNILDSILKNIIKYKSLNNKMLQVLEKEKFNNLLGKKL